MCIWSTPRKGNGPVRSAGNSLPCTIISRSGCGGIWIPASSIFTAEASISCPLPTKIPECPRFGDNRVQALFAVLVMFSLQLRGFTNREIRPLLAQLLGLDPANYPIGRMTYDLRRLRLHGIIEQIPYSHRHQLTPEGLRIALFFSRAYVRLLRPKLAEIIPKFVPPMMSTLRVASDRLTATIDAHCEEERLVA
jgi:hypothetical protein